MTPPPRTFRPARVPLKAWPPIALFAVIVLVLVHAAIRDRTTAWLSPAGGAGLLLAAGLWLQLRLRFPGEPRLDIDAAGLTYRRGKRAQALAWRDVAAIEWDFVRDEVRFVPSGSGQPIRAHRSMVTADGEPLVGVFDDYWQPKSPARGCV